MAMMTRAEHLAWAKKRALEYIDLEGDLKNAVVSMASDLGKHPELKVVLMDLALMYVTQGDAEGVRRWIEGFN